MTKSRRGKLYIDDEGWGPEADSIEYGYRLPFAKFTSSLARSVSQKLSRIESSRRARPAKAKAAPKHVFVGFVHGVELEGGSESGGETVIWQ